MIDPTPPVTYAAWQPKDPSRDLSESDISRLVHTFYGHIRDHETLGPVFKNALHDDWGPHLDKMVDFWCSMMLGVKRYDGRPLPVHVNMPDLKDEHFGQWLALFHITTHSLFTPDVAGIFMERAQRMAQSFRYAIALHADRPAAPAHDHSHGHTHGRGHSHPTGGCGCGGGGGGCGS